MQMDPRTKSFRELTELVPLGLVLAVLRITVCLLNIIYRSSRFFLIKSVFHCICAPLYKVTLLDFFLADQLTSQPGYGDAGGMYGLQVAGAKAVAFPQMAGTAAMATAFGGTLPKSVIFPGLNE